MAHLKSYSQWLRVQMETNDKWSASRVWTGTNMINIYVTHIAVGLAAPSASLQMTPS